MLLVLHVRHMKKKQEGSYRKRSKRGLIEREVRGASFALLCFGLVATSLLICSYGWLLLVARGTFMVWDS